jgi:hypothetical protein
VGGGVVVGGVGGFVGGGVVGCALVTVNVVAGVVDAALVAGPFVVGSAVVGAAVLATVDGGRFVIGRVETGRVVTGCTGRVGGTVDIGDVLTALVVGPADLVVGLGAGGAATPAEPALAVTGLTPPEGVAETNVVLGVTLGPAAAAFDGFVVRGVGATAMEPPTRVLETTAEGDVRTTVLVIGAAAGILTTSTPGKEVRGTKVRTTDVATPMSTRGGNESAEPLAGPTPDGAFTTNPGSSTRPVSTAEIVVAISPTRIETVDCEGVADDALALRFVSATTNCGRATKRCATSATDAQPSEEAATVPTNQVEIRKKNLRIRTE